MEGGRQLVLEFHLRLPGMRTFGVISFLTGTGSSLYWPSPYVRVATDSFMKLAV